MGELAQNWVQAETVITLPKLEHIVTGRGVLMSDLTAKPNFSCILSAANFFIKIRLISGLAELFAADFRRRV